MEKAAIHEVKDYILPQVGGFIQLIQNFQDFKQF